MSAQSIVQSVLQVVDIDLTKQKEAEACLGKFAALDSDAKKAAISATIGTIFPLLFGDIASVDSSPNYSELKDSPWSTNCFLSPATILIPSTAQQVSKILDVIRFLGATFSIRGGGRLHNPGFTSNNGGVVISMVKFSQCKISEDKQTVEIGTGLRWLDVYKALEEHDVAVTGGRVPHVGVPGLLLGGGLSFQNSRHGFSCMGVRNYEVVLADGKIVNANATENQDLFWSLKGGGANFGVVTKVDMMAVSNKVWAEARIYGASQNQELLNAVMQYHDACEKDPEATLIWLSTAEMTLLVFFYCSPVEKPDAFKCFYDIPFMMNVIPPGLNTVYGVLQGISNILTPEILMHDMRTLSSLPDLEVYRAAEAARVEQVEALKNIEGAILTFVIQPIASGAIKTSNAEGGNTLGLTAQNQQWMLVMADWKNASDEPFVRDSLKKIIDAAESVSKKNGTYLPFRYSNYSSRDQDPLSSYGQGNLQKLKDIAKKYDPEAVFQKLQNGGWLVSTAGTDIGRDTL